MKKRVYCLYRVSTKKQVEKDDIPMQKQKCREFAAANGWEIVRELSEKGVSGFKVSAKDRDAIQEIQKDAAQGKFDILLVFMFDRLGRKEDETPFIVEWFVRNGIEVWSTVEGQQRFDSHVDKLMNYIRYWQASGESLKTSVRTKTRLIIIGDTVIVAELDARVHKGIAIRELVIHVEQDVILGADGIFLCVDLGLFRRPDFILVPLLRAAGLAAHIVFVQLVLACLFLAKSLPFFLGEQPRMATRWDVHEKRRCWKPLRS